MGSFYFRSFRYLGFVGLLGFVVVGFMLVYVFFILSSVVGSCEVWEFLR